tara:strand:- start:1879 stop:2001 length:123 start_codon:yes stop_codon:yes gene_type:complete
VEIIIGIVIAIYWIRRDKRYEHYEKGEWDKITKDIIDGIK